MIFLHRCPAPPLNVFVDTVWYCADYEAPHRHERVLPSGAFQIVIDLIGSGSASLVIGAQSRSGVIETAALKSVAGIAFKPGGARAFLAEPADDFFNRHVPLDLVWRSTAAELRERLQAAAAADATDVLRVLESALQPRARERAGVAMHRAVRYALSQFQVPNGHGVLDVAADAGLSRRRFAEIFRESVGVTPKLYSRLQRLRHVLRHISLSEDVDWVEIALACGYYDQAHFAHEFHEFSGMSPTAYLSRHRPWPTHVAID